MDEPLIINANAGWCWFQDPRLLVDGETGHVLLATVANSDGLDGVERDADIDVACFDPETGRATTIAVGNIPTHGHGDDHNGAALWQRPDGRYLVVYTGHNYGSGSNGGEARPDTFYRISERPHDISAWREERRFTWPRTELVANGRHAVTYSNLLHLSAEGGVQGRLYNIARASGAIWQIATSDDLGETWTYRGVLTRPPREGRAYSNGYMKFCGNGTDRIDFITTEAHPRDHNNGLYHGYIRGGRTFNTSGEAVGGDLYSLEAPLPESFPPIFAPRPVQPDSHHHAWPVELGRARNGVLFALFTTRYGINTSAIHPAHGQPGNADHRLFLGRLEGGSWETVELARMGCGLWAKEEDYTGLGAVDPDDARTVYVSTPIDPRDSVRLEKHEIFAGRCGDDFRDWSWTPVTENSKADQLRPRVVTCRDGRTFLFWLRGVYSSQHRYNQELVALCTDASLRNQ